MHMCWALPLWCGGKPLLDSQPRNFFFFMRHPEQLALRVTEVEWENWCVKIEAGTKKSHLLPQYRWAAHNSLTMSSNLLQGGNTDETNCQVQLHIHQIQSSLWHPQETNDTLSTAFKWDRFACCFPPPLLHYGKQLSVQHKHWIIMVHPICSSRCVYMPSFLDCPTPFFCIPSASLFQHLCWVHARASDKALCVPCLGNLPRFSSWLPAPPSWKPHNCLPFSCSPQSLFQPGRSP